MVPSSSQRTTPAALIDQIWPHRQLGLRLVQRDIARRYRGSMLGVAWSFVTPLVMLAVYTFVFTIVFKARWDVAPEGGRGVFALYLFAGLIVHGILADILTSAPAIVTSNTNYVKKVIFPLAILPMVPLGSALFQAGMSLIVLLLAELFVMGTISTTLWLLPLVLLPLAILALGISWFLAALGVYLRDIGHTMNLLATMLLFTSPVVYPLSALPPGLRPFILMNPLTFIIQQFRDVTINGAWPNWGGLILYTLVAGLIAWLGFVWFQKTRQGFADVI